MSELYVAETGDDPIVDMLFHNEYGTDQGYVSGAGVTKEFPAKTGWDFGAGNPEFWHYADRLVKPGGTVLDIGMEYGRSSMYFALNGMHVVGIDTNAEALGMVDATVAKLAPALELDVTTFVGDAFRESFGQDGFDVVILDHTFNHASSKAEALTLLDKAFAAVKPAGHIWVRALGKEDGNYDQLRDAARWGETEIVDEDVIKHPCGCSGEYSIDPSLFFGQTDLLQYFAHRGATIAHSQLMPADGRRNFMFGEDYNREMPVDTSAFVTILAQK